ncbi:LysR substrate-binding domain-containing protein [Paracoccus cavernae]|uniref:LysR substrate-binding domain-containing protein n=1 Tax=Paracoccus cavernae TaxID=1571207 RepID=UPI0035F2DA39
MLDLNDFLYFHHVVNQGGFTAAANKLQLSKSTLSHRIKKLEAELGVRLLNRTSRSFGLTDAGTEFFQHATSMLQQAEQAEISIRHRLSEPSGTIRFTTSTAIAQFAMSGIVADFLTRFPKVNVSGTVTDQSVDIVAQNIDIAIRAHSEPLPDSALVQRTLSPAPWQLFAGAAYLESRPAPQSPQDLAGHPSLFMMRTGVPAIWRLRHIAGKGEYVLPLAPRLVSNDMVGLKRAAISGLGIVALPAYICRDDLQAGGLRRVLPDWSAGDSTLTALLSCRQGQLPSVRAFVDHLVAEIPKMLVF